jgi:restriction system protein
MPIPDFQSLMRPYLNAISTEATFKTGDVVEKLANELGLSELERQELLPSGKQARFDNRVGWTRTHLAKAGLITSPARGVITITSRGLEALKSDEPIDMAYLSRYPEYLRFRTGAQSYKASQLASPSKIASEDSEKTPQEVISDNISYLEQTLADELLAKIMESSPKFFEQLVVDLLLAMGYGGSRKEAGQAIGKANDGGIDGIINEDRLGLDTIYIQAKRWTNPVDAKTVREFGGALMGQVREF